MIKNKDELKLNKEEITEYLSSIPPYCEKCGTMYNKDKVEVIDKNQNMTIIYIMCENCKTKNVFYVVKPMNFVSRANLIVDLDMEEIKKFAGSRKIDSNDILNVFDLLSTKKAKNSKDFLKIINSNV